MNSIAKLPCYCANCGKKIKIGQEFWRGGHGEPEVLCLDCHHQSEELRQKEE